MKVLVLKERVLAAINSDPDLFGKVAKSLNLSVYTLPKLIKENSPKLTQASTLLVLKTALAVSNTDDLLQDRKELPSPRPIRQPDADLIGKVSNIKKIK